MIIIIMLHMAKYKQNQLDDCGHTVGIAPPWVCPAQQEMSEKDKY